jgi:hypothetical protein
MPFLRKNTRTTTAATITTATIPISVNIEAEKPSIVDGGDGNGNDVTVEFRAKTAPALSESGLWEVRKLAGM